MKMIGINFVELNVRALADTKAVSRKMNGMVSSFHLPIVNDDGWDFSCLDFTEEIDETIRKINQNKHRLNMQHVVSHPPEQPVSHQRLRTCIDFLFKNLRRLDLPVYLENVPGYGPQDIIEMLERAKKVLGGQAAGICFDAPHFLISGYDVVEQYKALKPHIGCLHLSDCFAHKDAHLPFNTTGVMPIDRLLKELKNQGFSGYITLEIRPRSLRELDAYIKSYLISLKYLNFFKFGLTWIRAKTLSPFLRILIR